MQVYIGIDWSECKHDIVFMNEAGGVVTRYAIDHNEVGFWQIEQTRQQLDLDPNDCLVGIETERNLLVEFFWQQGYERIYIIPPTVTKSSRGRHRSSRARTDQSDAELLADLVRTDRSRLLSWEPNHLLTRQIAAKVSLVRFLTKEIVRMSNRLRTLLLCYYPVALKVFSRLSQVITLEFIRTFATPIAADQLSFAEFCEFARRHRYPNKARLAACYARLHQPCAPVSPENASIYQEEAQIISELLLKLIRMKKQALKELVQLFHKHPDHSVFASLPGTGDQLAPALLAQFGDDRKRFPAPHNVQSLAGTCPVTVESGKRRVVRYRYACDRQFRAIAVQWAKASLKKSPWANAYFQEALHRQIPVSQAYRCLANRLLAIAWKLWQTRQMYDEAYHLKQRNLHKKPR
jgi:transposase